ncbi:MAG: hypothetical protein LBL58_19220 [Tannerellaceae bacterium]|jgi:hypothetical protein|nr:hypothetical protein [Tannerellaceae bacterium]
MNLHPRTYHYIGKITLENDCTLKQERLSDEDIDPWLFLVFDKKGERRFTFFYKIEQPTEFFCKKSFNILMHFIVEEGGIIDTKKVMKLNETYDVWRAEKFIGTVKIIRVLK